VPSTAFPKLHSHPNLKGTLWRGLGSALVIFATFPGAVLMSKGALQCVNIFIEEDYLLLTLLRRWNYQNKR